MSWFRLEGRGAFHHKVLAAGNEAYGAWCRAGQWSCEQLTDGLVPRAVAEQIAKPKVWLKLVEARLLLETDVGYQIHDFLDFNPSSEQERAKREELRERRRESGRAGGKRSGEVRRGGKQLGAPKQTGSKPEANRKQSASTGASFLLKQNEAPSPSPSPSPSPEGDQQTHTPRAHPPAQGEDRPKLIPCTEEDLAALLRASPFLADIGADPERVKELLGSFRMALGDAGTAELARRAMGALLGRESATLPSLNADGRQARVGAYLPNARRYNGDAERMIEPVHPDARAVLETFAEVWGARKKRAFVRTHSDEKKASDLVEPAREAGQRLKLRPSVIVRHWTAGYVDDTEPFVADKDHPFALFVSRINQYGFPKGPGSKRSPAAIAAGPAPVGPPPDLGAGLAGARANYDASPRRPGP